LLNSFLRVVREVAPDAIITHPYEGGHPDHDTAALMVQIISSLTNEDGDAPWARLEMTSYHARNRKRCSGEFLPGSAANQEDEMTLNFSPEERSRKARMLSCYSSQRHVLAGFSMEPERFASPQGTILPSHHTKEVCGTNAWGGH